MYRYRLHQGERLSYDVLRAARGDGIFIVTPYQER